MQDIHKIYTLKPNISEPELKKEAEELLFSVAIMLDTLQKTRDQKISIKQNYILQIIHDLMQQLIELYICLYDIKSMEVWHYLSENRIFMLKKSTNKEQLQKNLFDRVYQLNSICAFTVNDLLDEFNSQQGNILIYSTQRIHSLINILESLELIPKIIEKNPQYN